MTTGWDITGSATQLAETQNAYVTQVDPSGQVQGSMDFNGDGISDLVWRNSSTGVFSIWDSTGPGFTENAHVGAVDPAWTWPGSAQRRRQGGEFTIWSCTGASFTLNTGVNASVDTTWHIQGIGDFNGDGMGDILWRNTTASGATQRRDYRVAVHRNRIHREHLCGQRRPQLDPGRRVRLRRRWQGRPALAQQLNRRLHPWESTGSGFDENALVDGSDFNACQIVSHHYESASACRGYPRDARPGGSRTRGGVGKGPANAIRRGAVRR